MKSVLSRKNSWLARRRSSQRIRFGAEAGDQARRFNRLDDAIHHYTAHLRRRPRDLGVQQRLIGVLREVGRTGEATTMLKALVARRPREIKLQVLLAEVLDESGDHEAALDMYEAILRKSSTHRAAGEAADQLRRAFAAANAPLPQPPAIGVQNLGATILTATGTVLRAEAADWFAWAISQGATAAYADHEGGGRELYLQSAPHPLDLATNPFPPPAAIFAGNFLREGEELLSGLMRAMESGGVMHIPLILSRQPSRPEARTATFTVGGEWETDRLLVVIPTRDSVAELNVMTNSLAARAARPDLIDVVVVDNGSCPPLISAELQGWREAPVEVLRVDEPFNWSRLNNLACAGRSQPIVVFANNDMEMMSSRWDDRVRKLLSDERVGAVGARLLYPSGLLQHGGIVMGALDGEPLHDGWRAHGDDPGPLDRWVRLRPATAVTGGFLATKRSVFDQVGGFDEIDLPVSCSDVDYCLKVGSLGLAVLYAPEVELRHHESLTRGHAHTDEDKKRSVREMGVILDRWKAYVTSDPTRNPQWERRGLRLYAGRRALTQQEVVDWSLKTRNGPSRL